MQNFSSVKVFKYHQAPRDIIITNMSAADPVNWQLLVMNTAGPGQNNTAFMKLTFSQYFL